MDSFFLPLSLCPSLPLFGKVMRMGSVIMVLGLGSGLVMTCGYGGAAVMTTLDLGRNVGTGDGAKLKGSTETISKGGVG
jgi:hypothetical protein